MRRISTLWQDLRFFIERLFAIRRIRCISACTSFRPRSSDTHQALSHLCFHVGRGAVAHQARADALYALILIDSWRPWCSCSSSPLALVFSCRPWCSCSSSPLRYTIWRSCSSSPPTLVYSCRPWCSCSDAQYALIFVDSCRPWRSCSPSPLRHSMLRIA